MKNYLLLSALLICVILCGCAPQAKPISPPPYPPPTTPATPILEGSVMGKVMLQGRTSHAGVTLTIGELAPVATSSDGGYAVLRGVPKGQHIIKAEKTGYLSAEGHVIIEDEIPTKTMPPITLLAGDLNGDGTVNLFDLVLVGTIFGQQDMESLRSDLNGDGMVNLFDLVLVGNNLGRNGPLPFE